MLPDERTTHENELSLPSEVEGLVVAPGRAIARALIGFLRDEGINVRTVGDANAAFEEALLHPPDVVLIDERVPPDGGIELVQRLKTNVRTHFVPVILYTTGELPRERVRAFEAGADAVFEPTTPMDERHARVWALLRTRALFRRGQRAQRTQTSEIVDRRQWLSQFLHDLKGQIGALAANVDYVAKFGPDRDDPRRRDFDDSVEDAHGIFEQLKASVRTVIDYDRFESGQLVPRDERFELRAAATEAIATLRRLARPTERMIALTDAPRAGRREPSLYGDRELVTCAILNLGMGALRRAAPRSALQVDIVETDAGMRFRLAAPGTPLQAGEKLNIFAPYGRHPAGGAMYGLGLALARALIELQGGTIWVEDLPAGAGCAFVFELGWKRALAKPSRGVGRGKA